MNKKELVDTIASTTGVKKSDVEKVLLSFEDVIIETLKGGDKVTLVGFGTFSVTNRKERVGRNPQTGKEITIAARMSPKFVAGKNFKSSISK